MSHPPFSWDAGDRPKFSWEGDDTTTGRASTSLGRLELEAEDKAKQLEAYKQALQQPGITPERKAMLERVIANIESPQGSKVVKPDVYNKVIGSGFATPEEGAKAGTSFLHGVAKGGINTALTLAETPLMLGDVVVPGAGLARAGRRHIQEARAGVEEALPSEGASGLVGELAGGLAVGAGPYTAIAKGTALTALKFLPQGSKLARVINAANSANTWKRIGAQEVINVPIDALQSLTMLDASTQEKLTQLGIAVGGTALGAAVQRGGPSKAITPPDVSVPKPVNLETPPTVSGAPAQATLESLQAKLREAEALEQLQKATKEARREYRKQHPDKKWKDLSEAERASWVAKVSGADVEVVPPSATEVKPPEAPTAQPKEVDATSAKPRSAMTEIDKDIEQLEDTIEKLKLAQLQSEAVGNHEGVMAMVDEQMKLLREIDKLRALQQPNVASVAPMQQETGPRTFTFEEKAPEPDSPEFQSFVDRVVPKDQEVIPGTRFKFADKEFAYNGLNLEEVSLPPKIANNWKDLWMRAEHEPLHENPADVAEFTQRFHQLSKEEQEGFHQAYDALIKKFESGTLDPDKTRLLKNLQAMDVFMADRELPIEKIARDAEVAATKAEETVTRLESAAHPTALETAKELETRARRAKETTAPVVEEPRVVSAKKETARVAAETKAQVEAIAAEASKPKLALRTIPNLPKPLKDMTLEELKEVKAILQQGREINPKDQRYIDDLLDVTMAERLVRKTAHEMARKMNPSEPSAIIGQEKKAGRKQPRAEPEQADVVDAKTTRGWYKADLKTMDDNTLALHRADAENRIANAQQAEFEKPYRDRLDQILAEQARRENPPREGGPLLVQMPPELGGAVVGFITGGMTGENPDEIGRNALIGAAVGAGLGYGGRVGMKMYDTRQAKATPKFPGSEAVDKAVVNLEQLAHGKKGFRPFASRWERLIEGTMRPGFLAQKIDKLVGGRGLGWALSFGKQTVEGSDAINSAIQWSVGRPSIHKLDGTYVDLADVKNLHEILDMVENDWDNLGKVAYALTVVEKATNPVIVKGKVEPRLTVQQAVRFLQNIPQKYHDAAKEFRKWHAGLMEQAVELEMISRADADKALAELDYTPIQRVYDDVLLQSKGAADRPAGQNIGAPTQIHERKGARKDSQVLNPVQTALDRLPKYMWSFSEQRRKLTLLAMRDAERAMLRGENKETSGGVLSRLIERVLGTKKGEDTGRYYEHVINIAKHLNMREAAAEQLFDSFNPKPVTPDAPTFSVWKNGMKETWKVDPDLAELFRMPSKQAEELAVDVLERLTKGVRFGVTRDPFFIFRMGLIDNWQAYTASNYGYRFGLDWVNGWLNQVKNTPEFKNYTKGRPGHLLSEVYRGTDPESLLETTKRQEALEHRSILRDTKEMKLGQVFNTIISQISEAGRVGLYLAARRRGASIDDAIYEATMAIGNYATRGKKLEKLTRTALFLNPAVKALDSELSAMGLGRSKYRETADGLRVVGTGGVHVDPKQAAKYVMKATTAISIPTLALYYLGKDDPDIERLRKTDAGRRYWFVRMGDEVVRIRKPFISGQIFGTGLEQALDVMRDNDPAGVDQWLGSLMEDLPLNVLPTGLGIAYGLAADKDPLSGVPLAGKAMEALQPAERERHGTSDPARMVGQALDPISKNTALPEFLRRGMSPIGIDFLVRNLGGTLASEALQGLTVAREWVSQNYLRPASEMPLIRSALANTNTASSQDVEQFYTLVQRVDEAMNTMNHLSNDPVALAEFFERNKETIGIAKFVREARDRVGEMRQSLEDVRTAPNQVISADAKQRYRRSINNLITQQISFVMSQVR